VVFGRDKDENSWESVAPKIGWYWTANFVTIRCCVSFKPFAVASYISGMGASPEVAMNHFSSLSPELSLR